MSEYRELSSDEVIAVTTLNTCANAITDNLPKLARRLKATGKQSTIDRVEDARRTIEAVVRTVIEESPDIDQQAMITTRMSRLKLQFGHVRKHPEDLVIMSVKDAQTLLAPVLDRCDIDCPCVCVDADGDKSINTLLVKQCETRKALKRIGMSEVGLSIDCPYQMMPGGNG